MQLTYAQAAPLVATAAENELAFGNEGAFGNVVTIPVFGLVTGSAISLTLWAALVWAAWVILS